LDGYRIQVVAGVNYLFRVIDTEGIHLVKAYIPVYCDPTKNCVVFQVKEVGKAGPNNEFPQLIEFQDGTPI
jgi:hypothetical protein